MKTYNYIELDDLEASIYGLTIEEVNEIIEEHNEFFDTEYKTIEEFNYGEQQSNGIRQIEINYEN